MRERGKAGLVNGPVLHAFVVTSSPTGKLAKELLGLHMAYHQTTVHVNRVLGGSFVNSDQTNIDVPRELISKGNHTK